MKFKVLYNENKSEELSRDDFAKYYKIATKDLLDMDFKDIDKIKHNLDWEIIPIYHKNKLSEKFISHFADEIDWRPTSRYQKLSEKFIDKYKDKLDKIYLLKNQKMSKKFRETVKTWKQVYGNPKGE